MDCNSTGLLHGSGGRTAKRPPGGDGWLIPSRKAFEPRTYPGQQEFPSEPLVEELPLETSGVENGRGTVLDVPMSHVGTRGDNNIAHGWPGVVHLGIRVGEGPLAVVRGVGLGLDVATAIETCDVFVGGSLFDALAERQAPAAHYVVAFSMRNCTYFSTRVSLSPQRRGSSEWRNASLRIDGKCKAVKGVLSLWVNDSVCAVIYHDGNKVLRFIEETWAISSVERNRLMHALNGNGGKKRASGRKVRFRESADERAVQTVRLS